MADVKHTPGPWTSYPCNLERYSRVITANGAMVQIAMTKEVYGDRRTYEPGEETTANARLIAAAPDLLESLRAFVSPWDGDSVEEIESQSGLATSVRIEQARAAIAKATGAARATEGSATDAAECTCAAKDMPFGRCCKAGAA
jgi:hypothetical protein